MTGAAFGKRLRICAVLVILGLAAQAGSLAWRHPTAFLAFVLVGGTLMGAGIGYYLYSVISTGVSKGG